MSDKPSPALTYSAYLALDELLAAQRPLSADGDGPEHDELLFIIIHQTYELWFKQLLHELDFAKTRMGQGQINRTLHTLKRIRTIFKVIVGQIDILETMTPLEFSSFRDRLDQSSGLQSVQFREIECCLGLKDPAVLDRYADDPERRDRIAKRLAEPTLWDAFVALLDQSGYAIPKEALEVERNRSTQPNPGVQAVLAEIYRSDHQLSGLCEALTDIDEGLSEWRYRHVKMVQRTIGTKAGTGGTMGVAYLQTTLDKTLFPDLWAVRASL